MKTENVILMRMARESLRGKWGLAVGTVVVYELIIIILQMIPVVKYFIPLIITGPLVLGLTIFFLSISRDQDAKLIQLFKGFNNFAESLIAMLLITLFTILWTLLLVIPGIIASLSYSMTFYILADDKSIGGLEAISKSKKMMNGYKWKYFCLGLRFIGWIILSILTLGIVFFWVVPYMRVSAAKFYDDIKANSIEIETA